MVKSILFIPLTCWLDTCLWNCLVLYFLNNETLDHLFHILSKNILFRKTSRLQTSRRKLENPSFWEQHSGDLRQARCCSPRQDLDLEGCQLWLSWLHEDHELRGPGRDLQGQDRHEGQLRGHLERGEEEARGDDQAGGHPALWCLRDWVQTAVVPLVSEKKTQKAFSKLGDNFQAVHSVGEALPEFKKQFYGNQHTKENNWCTCSVLFENIFNS